MLKVKLDETTELEIGESRSDESAAHAAASVVREVTLARVELKKGCYVPSHQHENEQISHVLEGALKFISEGKEYLVRAGEMLVIPSHAPHDALALEDTTVLDIFAPARADWARGQDQYLRTGATNR